MYMIDSEYDKLKDVFRSTRAIFFGCLAASLAGSVAWGQFGGGGAQRSTPATQLPDSGRQTPGSVTTQQQAGATPGTNVVRSSIQIGHPRGSSLPIL